MANILTHARRFPMMAERQVVIVKAQDIQDLNKGNRGKLLLDYLAKPVPSTCWYSAPLQLHPKTSTELA